MKKIKQSDTVDIMRSQITLNPYNPKRHTDKQINEQKKNLQHVGFLGGVTWNESTGNLIDGHRRIKAMDLLYKYDGTPETDYQIKVERVNFDEKQEKEQMTFMALGNTKADYELIAEYLPEIDYTYAGIDEYDLEQIQSFIPDNSTLVVDAMDDIITPMESEKEPTPSEKRETVKEAKASAKERAIGKWQDLNAYITISFSNAEEKRLFCEMAGIGDNEMYINGTLVLEMIQ